MGTALSAIRQQASKTADNKEVQDTIQLLFENAEKEISAFNTQVLFESKTKKQIQARKQLINISDIKAKVQIGTSIGQEIGGIISTFAKGEVIQGVTKIIEGALKAVLGNFAAGRSKKRFHLITLGKMGSIVRVDYLLSAYEFKGKSIMDKLKTVVVFCYIVTSVDMDDIKLNDVEALIDLQYDDLTLEQKDHLLQRTMRRTLKRKDPEAKL